MQLHQIKYLITVAETKSIRKASEKLYVSQQAVSQSIRKLEEEYDVKLINRSVHGVSLTYEGEEVVKLAKPVWTNYLILEDHLKSLNNNTSPAGELIVASITSFHRYVLPKAKVAFIRNYPNVHYSQLPLLTQQVIDAVSSGEADIGFLGVPFQDNVPLLKIPDGLQCRGKLHEGYRFQLQGKSGIHPGSCWLAFWRQSAEADRGKRVLAKQQSSCDRRSDQRY